MAGICIPRLLWDLPGDLVGAHWVLRGGLFIPEVAAHKHLQRMGRGWEGWAGWGQASLVQHGCGTVLLSAIPTGFPA